MLSEDGGSPAEGGEVEVDDGDSGTLIVFGSQNEEGESDEDVGKV